MKLTKQDKALAIGVGATLAEALFLYLRQGTVAGSRTIVRCREGHLFNTIWIPGASVKALRLGPWRVQRCPVGAHWDLVAPVRVSELSDEDREQALSRRDARLP